MNNTIPAIDGLCNAVSILNYHQICQLVGWSEDDYSQGKYKDLVTIWKLLGHFDNTTLGKLIEAGKQP